MSNRWMSMPPLDVDQIASHSPYRLLFFSSTFLVTKLANLCEMFVLVSCLFVWVCYMELLLLVNRLAACKWVCGWHNARWHWTNQPSNQPNTITIIDVINHHLAIMRYSLSLLFDWLVAIIYVLRTTTISMSMSPDLLPTNSDSFPLSLSLFLFFCANI